jgi:hypothetical protein
MKAALGPPSAGGIGTPEFEVTQSGGGPNEFVAIQPGGNVGGVWLSKRSVTTTGFQQPKGPHEGVGTGPWTARPTSKGKFRSTVRGAIAFEEVITAATNANTAVAQMAKVDAGLIAALLSFPYPLCEEQIERVWSPM